MTQKRSQRMSLVLQLAERSEQQAAEQLGLAREQVDNSEQQLHQLLEYQREYIGQINGKSGSQNIQDLLSDRAFIGQLEQASDLQRQKIVQAQQLYQQVLQAWQKAYRKRSSIEELIQRLRDTEEFEADKLLQKELDELATLNHRRNA